MDLKADERFIADVARELVRINSVNPSLSPGGPGEAGVASYTAGILDDLGLNVTRLEHAPRRISVVGVYEGAGNGPRLMLNAHYDTVGVEGMSQPFSGEIRGRRLLGRGAYDMKGALAACIGAVEILKRRDVALVGDVVVAAVADEEHSSLGTSAVIQSFPVDAAIVAEPTQLEICLAHKGFVWLEVQTRGRAAHGSQYADGIDANLHMGRVLTGIEALQRSLESRDGHPLTGAPSVHAAKLSGGTAMSVYSARCMLGVERRTVPGETAATAVEEIRAIIESLQADDPNFEATLAIQMVRDPFEVPSDAEIVTVLSQSVETVLGHAPRVRGEAPWMDSALLSQAGVETVVLGPSGGGAHSESEWVDLDSMVQLAEILANAARSYCS